MPQSAVIDTGSQKIVYREAEPGVFEGVLVKLGPKMIGPDRVAFFPVLDGLEVGTKIVTTGSFLVDAETRLNPSAGSIYFGGSGGSGAKSSVTTIRPSTPEDTDAKLTAALAKLSPEDRKAAAAQRFCPILTQNRLGSMGTPVKVTVGGEAVFLCCAGCRDKALSEPAATLAKVKELRERKAPPAPATDTAKNSKQEQEIKEALAELAAPDRLLAESQRFCVVERENRLGSMGPPVKLMIDGQSVFLCCEACRDAALENSSKSKEAAKQLQTQQQKPATSEDKSPAAAADAKIAAVLAKLSPEDRTAAEKQRFCAVLQQNRLGSMGAPVKLMIGDEAVFLCCSSCRSAALKNPQQTLAKAKELRDRTATPAPESDTKDTKPEQEIKETQPESKPKATAADAKIIAALAKLSADDRAAAEKQRFCAVLEKNRLGSMGVPVKLMIGDEPVFLCCASCRSTALKNPQQTLAKAKGKGPGRGQP